MADDTDDECCIVCGHVLYVADCKCNCELRPLRDEVAKLEEELRTTLSRPAKLQVAGGLTEVLDKLASARFVLSGRESLIAHSKGKQ